jgi:hypothetical protein
MKRSIQILAVSPRVQCEWCERWTHIAYFGPTDRMTDFEPVCPVHGFIGFPEFEHYPDKLYRPTREERRLQRFSIERFVLWHFGDLGRVTTISPIAPEQVPGWEQTETRLWDREELIAIEEDSMQAWRVQHTSRKATTRGYVVFNASHLDFTWFPEAEQG